jgi:hypothetical protein
VYSSLFSKPEERTKIVQMGACQKRAETWAKQVKISKIKGHMMHHKDLLHNHLCKIKGWPRTHALFCVNLFNFDDQRLWDGQVTVSGQVRCQESSRCQFKTVVIPSDETSQSAFLGHFVG